jgi:hypothetical protein
MGSYTHEGLKGRCLLYITTSILKAAKVGGPQISSANLKSVNLRTEIVLDLWTFRKCYNLRICDYSIIYCENPQIHHFSSNKYKLKRLSFEFRDDFCFFPCTWRFSICGLGRQGNLRINITNLWICDLRTGTPLKFADL